jgi:hypothetical protein
VSPSSRRQRAERTVVERTSAFKLSLRKSMMRFSVHESTVAVKRPVPDITRVPWCDPTHPCFNQERCRPCGRGIYCSGSREAVHKTSWVVIDGARSRATPRGVKRRSDVYEKKGIEPTAAAVSHLAYRPASFAALVVCNTTYIYTDTTFEHKTYTARPCHAYPRQIARDV